MKFIKKPTAEELDNCALFDEIFWYMNALSNNGQVIDGFSIFYDDDFYYTSVILPDDDSLSDANNGYYVKENLAKLKLHFDIELLREGVNAECDEVCKCKKPSWYVLCVRPNSADYPLICGDCRSPVPLYKIPCLFNSKEHNAILNWSHSYEAISSLWLMGFDDRYTYKQQSSHNSRLSRDGQKICKELKKILGVPVYYYLFYSEYFYDADRPIKDLPGHPPELCPKCSFDWTCHNKKNPRSYKCDKCGLLADNPDWEG